VYVGGLLPWALLHTACGCRASSKPPLLLTGWTTLPASWAWRCRRGPSHRHRRPAVEVLLERIPSCASAWWLRPIRACREPRGAGAALSAGLRLRLERPHPALAYLTDALRRTRPGPSAAALPVSGALDKARIDDLVGPRSRSSTTRTSPATAAAGLAVPHAPPAGVLLARSSTFTRLRY
jgi:hypothetical protein